MPEDVDWKPFPAFPPSVRLAVVVGQPSEPGPYTIRVKSPHGAKLMPHKHPEDRVYTVISGVFYIGLGDEFDASKLEAYPPGAVIILPGNTPHFHWAKSGEYVTQVTAMGPLGLEYLSAKDDPRNNNDLKDSFLYVSFASCEWRLKMNDQQNKEQSSGVRDQEIRAALDQHWAASDANDFETEHLIYHEDAVLEYPQSGERTRGRSNIQNQRASQPNKKRFSIRRIIGGGDLWVTEFILTYDGKPSHTVSIMEFRGDKVSRETQYFADPFVAPASRAQWVERMDT